MKKAIPVIIAILLIVLIGEVTLGSMLVEKYSYYKERKTAMWLCICRMREWSSWCR